MTSIIDGEVTCIHSFTGTQLGNVFCRPEDFDQAVISYFTKEAQMYFTLPYFTHINETNITVGVHLLCTVSGDIKTRVICECAL